MTSYFGPLPEGDKGLLRDQDWQWMEQQTISAQKLISGSIQVGVEIGSQNFVSGVSGWQIDGDGNAEFNDVLIRGDIESGNWDGSSPANLTSMDSGASAGFYLDSSVGAAQFEGDVFVGGEVHVDNGTEAIKIKTDVGGSGYPGLTFPGATENYSMYSSTGGSGAWRVEGDGSANGFRISGGNDGPTLFTNGVDRVIVTDASTKLSHTLDMQGNRIDMGGGTIYYSGTSRPYITFNSNYVGINNSPWNLLAYSNRTEVRTNLDATVYRFYGDTDTQIKRPTSNHIDLIAGGNMKLRVGSGSPAVHIKAPYASGNSVLYLDIERGWNFLQRGTGAGTDLELRSTSNKGFFIGDTSNGVIADFHYGSIKFPGRATTTNSGLAAWRNNGFPGDHLLALSSSQEDKKDIRDANTKKYLKRIDGLRPVEYRSKTKFDDGRRVFVGVVKEEAEKVWPYWTYEAMTVPFLIAIQDLRKRVAELERQVA